MANKIEKQVWVKNFSLDLHNNGSKGRYIMLTGHKKNGRHRVGIPLELVKEIAEQMLLLSSE